MGLIPIFLAGLVGMTACQALSGFIGIPFAQGVAMGGMGLILGLRMLGLSQGHRFFTRAPDVFFFFILMFGAQAVSLGSEIAGSVATLTGILYLMVTPIPIRPRP